MKPIEHTDKTKIPKTFISYGGKTTFITKEMQIHKRYPRRLIFTAQRVYQDCVKDAHKVCKFVQHVKNSYNAFVCIVSGYGSRAMKVLSKVNSKKLSQHNRMKVYDYIAKKVSCHQQIELTSTLQNFPKKRVLAKLFGCKKVTFKLSRFFESMTAFLEKQFLRSQRIKNRVNIIFKICVDSGYSHFRQRIAAVYAFKEAYPENSKVLVDCWSLEALETLSIGEKGMKRIDGFLNFCIDGCELPGLTFFFIRSIEKTDYPPIRNLVVKTFGNTWYNFEKPFRKLKMVKNVTINCETFQDAVTMISWFPYPEAIRKVSMKLMYAHSESNAPNTSKEWVQIRKSLKNLRSLCILPKAYSLPLKLKKEHVNLTDMNRLHVIGISNFPQLHKTFLSLQKDLFAQSNSIFLDFNLWTNTLSNNEINAKVTNFFNSFNVKTHAKAVVIKLNDIHISYSSYESMFQMILTKMHRLQKITLHLNQHGFDYMYNNIRLFPERLRYMLSLEINLTLYPEYGREHSKFEYYRDLSLYEFGLWYNFFWVRINIYTKTYPKIESDFIEIFKNDLVLFYI